MNNDVLVADSKPARTIFLHCFSEQLRAEEWAKRARPRTVKLETRM